jgi:DNA invertase Pin-like site-specific DNA recombinase
MTHSESSISGVLHGYARVSTHGQVTDRQTDALRLAGVDEAHLYVDQLSGSTLRRPALDKLLAHLRPGDTVVIQSLDRLGRNTRQLLEWVDDLSDRGVHLRILQLGVDSSTPAGKMVLTVIAALAAMEREVLIERTKDGIASAKARGRVGGRPSSLSGFQREEALRLSKSGRSTGDLASLFGCSPRTIRRIIAVERDNDVPFD